jgi:hypothetical protein
MTHRAPSDSQVALLADLLLATFVSSADADASKSRPPTEADPAAALGKKLEDPAVPELVGDV